MDYTIGNVPKLFDALIALLKQHEEEPGVGEALIDLGAARINYVQRSVDHMIACLVLTIHDLSSHPLNPALSKEIKSIVHDFVRDTLESGARLTELARQYEANGGKLLSR
jgi:hypothetical protein